MAQRERRRLVEAARQGVAEEGQLLHRAARRDGYRRAEVPGTLLRDDDRTALDRTGRREEVGLPVRFSPADQLREGPAGLAVAPMAGRGMGSRLAGRIRPADRAPP